MLCRKGLLLLGLTLSVAGCTEAVTQGIEVKPVRTLVVDPQPMGDDRRAVGEVRPRYESEHGFRIAGKIISRMIDVGDVVMKGDTLARIDEQDYRNKAKSADADLMAAEAVLTEARGAEERSRALLSSGTTTRANYDAALRNLRSAEAKLDSARAAFELAKDQLSYSELHAEFDGIVTAVGAEAGQVVTSGRMIARVAQQGDKDAVFAIAESVFADGRPAGERPQIVISLLSNPNVTADGIIREISPMADPVTRTYQVRVSLKNPPEQMRFGASVVGRLKTSGVPVVALPAGALFDKDSRPAVWVIDPNGSAVRLKPVVVTRYETDRVIVSAGLVKGDVVVTAGVNRLRENQKVRLAEGGSR